MTSQRKPPTLGAMSIVSYEHASLEDAELRVLGPATIDVSASVLAGHTVDGDLAGLRPDTVTAGDVSDAVKASLGLSSVSSEGDGFISLAFWLEDAVIVMRCRHLIMDAVLDCWVDRVRGTRVLHPENDSDDGYDQQPVAG